MSVRVSAALMFAALAAAGCSDNDTSANRETLSVASAPVAGAEAKAVIEDWYIDGIFNSPHRCEAVRAAIARLPTAPRDNSTVYDDMRSLERRTCI